jgi:hypothetical protein
MVGTGGRGWVNLDPYNTSKDREETYDQHKESLRVFIIIYGIT